MNIKKLIIFLLLVLLCSLKSFPSTSVAFLDNGFGARAKAMGNGQVAESNDSFSSYWNPALLANIKTSELVFYQTKTFNLINTNFMAYSQKLFNITWNISYASAGVDDIWETTETGTDTGNRFSYKSQVALLSCGVDLYRFIKIKFPGKKIFIGSTIKLLTEQLYKNNAQGYGMDLGVLYMLTDDFKLGINIKNILQPKITWDTDSKIQEIMPRKIKIGLSKILIPNLIGTIDIDITKFQTDNIKYGIEYIMYKKDDINLFVRAGININELSSGIGISIGNLMLDYSYSNNSNDLLDSSSSFAIKYSFKNHPKNTAHPKNTTLKKVKIKQKIKKYKKRKKR